HAERIYPRRPIVTRRADRSMHRYTFADFAGRARRLAHALQRLGVRPGDRVATLSWNTYQHLEAYFGIPLCGGVLHTLNLRLHPHDIGFIVNDGEDCAVLVDHSLLALWEKVAPRTRVRHAIVMDPVGGARSGHRAASGMIDYETLLQGAAPIPDGP